MEDQVNGLQEKDHLINNLSKTPSQMQNDIKDKEFIKVESQKLKHTKLDELKKLQLEISENETKSKAPSCDSKPKTANFWM
jgi:hypothetical protein